MRRLIIFLTGFFLFFSITIANAEPHKKWTFLIFLNGFNNLDRFGTINIKQMEQVGSNDQINIVVQWASMATRNVVRLLVEKSNDPTKVTSPILENLGQIDMGDYRSLQDFVKWGVEHYPADHYFIDVWNHGSGWHYKRNHLNDISYDELSGNFIKTEDLGKAMAYSAQIIGHKVDIYGSDACLMGMAEVANEMVDSVHYFVGSQEVEPGMGWPYGDLLKHWTNTADATPATVSKILVNDYVKSYQGGSSGTSEVTFSAFDLDQLANLNLTLAQLSTDIQQLSKDDRTQVLNRALESQSFYFRDYRDLIDFTKKIAASPIQGLDPAHVSAVRKAASAFVIANKGTTTYKNAAGVSLWMPTDENTYQYNAARYQGLKFSMDTHWNDALKYLLQ